ncbi:MAG TPA: hypothetical protein DHU96_23375 [Actinobacteria bacterium]|nr:hypothetical protein [Actinomycetota bacterium]
MTVIVGRQAARAHRPQCPFPRPSLGAMFAPMVARFPPQVGARQISRTEDSQSIRPGFTIGR